MSGPVSWSQLTAQQLVRYEALFQLLDNIQALEDVAAIAQPVATQWKYFANVTSWRLVVASDTGFQVIDGFRGEATVAEAAVLAPWDAHHWAQQRPHRMLLADPRVGPAPPTHLSGPSITEVEVLPFQRAGRRIGLLSVAARHVPFNDLDRRFIRLFGSHFADRVSDILLRRQAMATLINKATRDALTGLLNRGTIIDRLCQQLAQSARDSTPLGLVLVDIDFFKIINDSHGHQAGDEVLRELARRLQAQTRAGDSLGRYGGEEFLFVLPACPADELARVAERLRRTIAQTPFDLAGEDGRSLDVTISLGAACSGGQPGIGMQGLLKQADVALYQSKANGRNRVTMGPLPGPTPA